MGLCFLGGKRDPSSDRLFPWQQGLWECHGSNITADITRRAGSCSWCRVSRRPPRSRWRNLLRHLEMSVFFISPPPPPLFLKGHFLLSAGSTVTAAVFPPAGPRAAHAQVLHPAEVGLHRQALLLWRGDEREVSAGQRRGTGQQQSLAGLRGEQVVVGGGSKGTVSPNNFPEQQVALLSCRGPPPKKVAVAFDYQAWKLVWVVTDWFWRFKSCLDYTFIAPKPANIEELIGASLASEQQQQLSGAEIWSPIQKKGQCWRPPPPHLLPRPIHAFNSPKHQWVAEPLANISTINLALLCLKGCRESVELLWAN